jgi:hypothetical protein
MSIKYIIIFVFISFILSGLFILDIKHNIQFLSAKETANFILKDDDYYVKNMSSADLYARKALTTDEYKMNASKYALDFTADYKQKLIKCAKKADEFLRNILDCNKIAKLKWCFALTDTYYEEGLPHTRKNLIFLSTNVIKYDDISLITTLIHEKVHIYQKLYEKELSMLLQKLGYIEKSMVSPSLKRSNPDINDKIYYDTNTEQLMLSTYKSNKPNSISDVENTNHSFEHPYEKMAYDIANDYTRYYWKNVTSKI